MKACHFSIIFVTLINIAWAQSIPEIKSDCIAAFAPGFTAEFQKKKADLAKFYRPCKRTAAKQLREQKRYRSKYRTLINGIKKSYQLYQSGTLSLPEVRQAIRDQLQTVKTNHKEVYESFKQYEAQAVQAVRSGKHATPLFYVRRIAARMGAGYDDYIYTTSIRKDFEEELGTSFGLTEDGKLVIETRLVKLTGYKVYHRKSRSPKIPDAIDIAERRVSDVLKTTTVIDLNNEQTETSFSGSCDLISGYEDNFLPLDALKKFIRGKIAKEYPNCVENPEQVSQTRDFQFIPLLMEQDNSPKASDI